MTPMLAVQEPIAMESVIVQVVKALVVFAFILQVTPLILLLERKLLGRFQARIGPNRVGPYGLLQPLADVVKLMTKEDMIPSHVNKVFYLLAPFLAVTFALKSGGGTLAGGTSTTGANGRA